MATDTHNAAPSGFIEDYAASDEGRYDFDWESLFRSLGEPCADEIAQDQREKFASALREVLHWQVGEIGSKRCRSKQTALVGRRAMMLAWVVDPELLDGASMECLAKDCGVKKSELSKIAVEIRAKFGIVNRSQRAHNWRLLGATKEGGSNGLH